MLFLKSYKYGFKRNQKPFGVPKSGQQTKKQRKERLHVGVLETKTRGKISDKIRSFQNKQKQPISGSFHALWSWKISNSRINKLGRK